MAVVVAAVAVIAGPSTGAAVAARARGAAAAGRAGGPGRARGAGRAGGPGGSSGAGRPGRRIGRVIVQRAGAAGVGHVDEAVAVVVLAVGARGESVDRRQVLPA